MSLTRRTVLLAVGAVIAGGAGAVLLSEPGSEMHRLAAPSYEFSTQDPGRFDGSDATPDLDPNRLSIPSIGVEVSWIETGRQGRELTIPEAPTAGWYLDSARPGSETGSVILAAHADRPDRSITPFGTIGTVAKGAPIFISTADGTTHRYRAASLHEYRQEALPQSLFDQFDEPQLVLITCSGASVKNANGYGYENNTVLTAIPEAP